MSSLVSFFYRPPISFWYRSTRCLAAAAGQVISAAVVVFTLGGAPAAAQSAREAPQLTRISPESGPAGIAYPIEATIQGSGFTPTDNTVEFGPVKIAGIASSDGRSIRFLVPKEVPSRGETPPMVFGVGEYPVRVTNGSGASNALTFNLRRAN